MAIWYSDNSLEDLKQLRNGYRTINVTFIKHLSGDIQVKLVGNYKLSKRHRDSFDFYPFKIDKGINYRVINRNFTSVEKAEKWANDEVKKAKKEVKKGLKQMDILIKKGEKNEG